MSYKTLVSTGVLSAHLDDPVIVDCRFKLDDVSWGEREYAAGHIPGAVYAHLDRDLSGPTNGTNGRHPLPDPSAAARTFGALGITSGVQVVVYDQDNGMFASRLWWMLRWLGHDAVAVLDGGFAKWTAEGRPIETNRRTPVPRDFIGSPRAEMTVDAPAVATMIDDPSWRLVDARAAERYRGDVEPIDRVAGHIPSAVNHFFQTNIDDAGLFRTPETLRARLQESIGAIPPDRVVCYCGSGVTACSNLLALEHAGLSGAKLYAGSWSEWSSDPSRPVARG